MVSTSGQVLFTGEQVQRGQQVWLASGGQQQGSVWGHGAYVAPDWSADWLHREAVALQAIRTAQLRKDPAALTASERGAVAAGLKEEMRRNTYDEISGAITVSTDRAQAIRETARHYVALFGNDVSLDKLRDQYAMTGNLLSDPADRQALTAFFFWTAWAAATDRPGEENLSYTSNWPHEPLVGNKMTDSAAIWSMVSIVLPLQTWKRSQSMPWLVAWKWPVMCFVAVGFWNTVGAGLLGFAINPPASLYYVQGLNLTAAHGHAALFGVYGMLGIGLMLFCLRSLYPRNLHADNLLKPAFWSLNVGLAMMVFLSLLPAGIYQAWASVSKGLWYARSPEVIHSGVMETLV